MRGSRAANASSTFGRRRSPTSRRSHHGGGRPAGGQFNICYRHHPDFQGKKPTHELIERLHREHLERQAAIHSKLQEIHQQLTGTPAAAGDAHGPGASAHHPQAAGDRQAE